MSLENAMCSAFIVNTPLCVRARRAGRSRTRGSAPPGIPSATPVGACRRRGGVLGAHFPVERIRRFLFVLPQVGRPRTFAGDAKDQSAESSNRFGTLQFGSQIILSLRTV